MVRASLFIAAVLLALVRAAWSLHGPLAAALLAGAALCALLFSGRAQLAPFRRRSATFLRGRRPLPELPVTPASPEADGTTLRWGGGVLPAHAASTHFLTVGTTGSGKTLVLNMLMRSVLPHIGKPRPDGSRADRRALVYDAKGDVLSTLHGTAECRIVTLHPFEARGAAWAMGQDITTPAAALQVAAILIPLEQGGSVNPFFRLAAQSLLRGTMLSFLQTVGQDWTFRDVLLALRYEERLRQVLEQTPDGRAILDQFCRRGETLHGIRATLAAHLAAFEVIAAAWDAAPEKVSLREWLAGESILVLGSDEMCRAALDAINRVLFQRLTELILASSESRTRQTWLFLDEVREAGRLEGLGRLLTKGRSKGACVALGFQAIEGMREVYGANVAEEIAGLCNQKIILHLDSPVSAEWASSLFGKREELDRRLSRSRSGRGPFSGLFLTQGSSRTHAESRLMSEALLASEVMTLPPTGPDQGLTGLCLSRGQGAYRQHLTWAQVQALQPVRAVGVADFEPRDEKHQYLREWDQDDFARLGLKPVWQVPTSMPQTGSLPLRVVRESS